MIVSIFVTFGHWTYRYGKRPIERVVAFGITMTLVVWFLWKNQHISVATGTGLFVGVVVFFIIRMLNVSPWTESWLVMVMMIWIGIEWGVKAAGMSLLGWLLLSLAMVLVINLVDSILWRKR